LQAKPGNTLKLRGTPKAFNYQAADRKTAVARLIASGMVTTLRDNVYGQSAAKPLLFFFFFFEEYMGKVQRLDGCGLVETLA
jgi:hypothetical protein